MKHRQPRPPVNGLPTILQPAGLVAIEEANIRQAVFDWRARWHPDGFESDASYRVLEKMYLQRLQDNDEILDASFIVDMALRGHPPADHALRQFIKEAVETDQFQRLPLSVRDYARRMADFAPLTGYPPRTSRTVNHFLRDACLVILMRRIQAHWPHIPLLNSSSGRTSIAALVGPVFGLSERQARRIWQDDKGQSRRVTEFMASRPFDPMLVGS